MMLCFSNFIYLQLFSILCGCVFCPHIGLPHESSLMAGDQESTGFCGTGVADACEPACGCWESKWMDPLEEQQVFLTTPVFVIKKKFKNFYFMCIDMYPVSSDARRGHQIPEN